MERAHTLTPCVGTFSVGMRHALHGGGRDSQRHRDLVAQHRCAYVSLRYVS